MANLAVSGGLSLDTYAAIKQGAIGQKSSAIIVPGSSAKSALVARLIARSPSKLMPKGGPALPPAQIAAISHWIDAGASEGAPIKGTSALQLSPEAAPMPVNRAALDVTIPTSAAFPPGLLEKGAKSVSLALRVGPLPQITAVAYSPDGKRLAIGGYRAVAIWDTATGQPVTCLTHQPGAVLALSFRPDGGLLAVGGGVAGAFGDVRIYDTKTWTQVRKPLTGHSDAVVSVCWSSDGTRLASGSQDKSARVWEWPSARELRVFKDHSDGVSRVCFSPDGKSLYTASLDHNARRFDVDKGGLIRVFTGHNDAITALAVSPDGKRLVTAGNEPNLRWWNTETGDTTNNNGGHGGSVVELAFAKDGALVASASADRTLRLWDAANTQPKRTLVGASDWLYTTAISPDSRFVAGAGADGVVRLWEAGSGRMRLSLLFWPPASDGTAMNWAVITPEGFCDASTVWRARLNASNALKGADTTRVRAALQALLVPQAVAKAWQGLPLDSATQVAK